MWTSLAQCYNKLNKKWEAIKCLEKAINCKDKEGIALFRMGVIYESINEMERAAFCFRQVIKNTMENDHVDPNNNDMNECYIFLAKYHMNKKEYKTSYEYLKKLKDYSGEVNYFFINKFILIFLGKRISFGNDSSNI